MSTEVDLARFAEDGVELDTRSVTYRYPIVRSPYPRWCYVTAVVVSKLYGGIAPTDDELRMAASFHEEYISRVYFESYAARMREKHPFDVDGSANGRYLIKYEHGGWAYRRSSWRDGPTFVPAPSEPPMSLVQVLDREKSGGSKPDASWEQWKAEHPDVFGVVPA